MSHIELIEQCCLSVLAGRTCKNHILRPGDNNPVVHKNSWLYIPFTGGTAMPAFGCNASCLNWTL